MFFVGPNVHASLDATRHVQMRTGRDTSLLSYHHPQVYQTLPRMRNVKCPCWTVGLNAGHLVARHKTREGHHEKDKALAAEFLDKGESVPKPLLKAVKANDVISAGKGKRGLWRACPEARSDSRARGETYPAARCCSLWLLHC